MPDAKTPFSKLGSVPEWKPPKRIAIKSMAGFFVVLNQRFAEELVRDATHGSPFLNGDAAPREALIATILKVADFYRQAITESLIEQAELHGIIKPTTKGKDD